MDNTLILVDYDNVFVTLKNNYRDFRNPNIMYDVITKIKDHYKTDNIVNYKLFADFQKVQISNDGYDILKKNHVEIEHVFSGKNASDIILMINCMKYMMQYPHINKIVLISSDSDIVPIYHEVQLLNKKLEVLYFNINTSPNHITHIKEIGIPNQSVEDLLTLDTCQECTDLESFYNYKKQDTTYFTSLLQEINNIIKKEYNKYLKKDPANRLTNVGCINLQTLSIKLNEESICPVNETRPSSSGKYSNLLDMLMDKSILIQHSYNLNGKVYTTLLLSEAYLNSESIIIADLLKISDYPN